MEVIALVVCNSNGKSGNRVTMMVTMQASSFTYTQLQRQLHSRNGHSSDSSTIGGSTATV